MSTTSPTRIGIMGFGQTGRQVYELASRSDDIVVAAIADIGDPDILRYLLCSETREPDRFRLEGNFLVNERFRSRMMQIDTPWEMPWDIFDIDMVVDSTGRHRDAELMQGHLENGASRVLIRTLPLDHIDRIVIPGVNEDSISAHDRMISAGSATTDALCLLLKGLAAGFNIECANMTSIHAYTSDQALQDYAGSDYRRSRSAAENIIPNTHEARLWLDQLLPAFSNKVLTYSLNVPIHAGNLLDTTLIMQDSNVDAEAVNNAMQALGERYPNIITVCDDPVVSSDIIGSPHSLTFDLQATVKAGSNTIKTLGWYDSMGHSARIIDIIRLYATLDAAQEAA